MSATPISAAKKGVLAEEWTPLMTLAHAMDEIASRPEVQHVIIVWSDGTRSGYYQGGSCNALEQLGMLDKTAGMLRREY